MSEARRGLARITTNYARLGATLAFGLVLVPLQLAWVGTDGFGLLVAIGASVGLAAMLQDVMRHSMVRELGVVWHALQEEDSEANRQHFHRVYASAFALCGLITVLTAIVFGVFYVLVDRGIQPFQSLDAEYRSAVKWILLAEGVSTFLLVLLSPASMPTPLALLPCIPTFSFNSIGIGGGSSVSRASVVSGPAPLPLLSSSLTLVEYFETIPFSARISSISISFSDCL